MAEGQVVSDSSLEFAARCARALAAGSELDDVLEGLLDAAIDQTSAGAAAVFVLDDDRAELTLAVGIGLDPRGQDGAADGFAVDLGSEDAIAQAIEQGSAVVIDPPEHPGTSRLLGLTDQAAAVFVPLTVVRDGIDMPVGVLSLCWSDTVPGGDTAVAVAAVADLAAVAIDRARTLSARAERSDYEERLAHTDPLTGLANRRTFDRMLDLELVRAARQGGEVTVALFDVDEFAETNRVGGRPAGDEILRAVASILAESVRLVDTVARYGADEFVVVAPGSAGMVVAHRVVEGVAALGNVAGRRVSVSAGVATFPIDGATAGELLASATTALSAARNSGGGAVGTAGASPAT